MFRQASYLELQQTPKMSIETEQEVELLSCLKHDYEIGNVPCEKNTHNDFVF